jgi:hypothetical protein
MSADDFKHTEERLECRDRNVRELVIGIMSKTLLSFEISQGESSRLKQPISIKIAPEQFILRYVPFWGSRDTGNRQILVWRSFFNSKMPQYRSGRVSVFDFCSRAIELESLAENFSLNSDIAMLLDRIEEGRFDTALVQDKFLKPADDENDVRYSVRSSNDTLFVRVPGTSS